MAMPATYDNGVERPRTILDLRKVPGGEGVDNAHSDWTPRQAGEPQDGLASRAP
jgi:hypothetical protein